MGIGLDHGSTDPINTFGLEGLLDRCATISIDA